MFYPEREVPREGALDRALVAAQYVVGGIRSSRGRLWRIVPATREKLSLEQLRPRLRREGFTLELAGAAFALVRAAAQRAIGMRHFDVQLVGFVVSPATATVRVLVSQDDVDLVRARTDRVEVMLASHRGETLVAKLRREVPAASARLPNPALAIQGGGLVATDPRQPDTPTALERWFEFELELPAERSRALGERVYVRFEHGWEPLGWRMLRALQQVFMRRFAL